MERKLDVLVFGAGALGSLLGGMLARAHDVTLVGREPHVTRVREDGLRISGEISARVTPDAVTDATGSESDFALVTVKTRDVDSAADALATGDHEVVCPLSNGLPEARLRESLGDRVLGGTATYGAQLVEPGHVRATGIGAIHVGEVDDSTATDAARDTQTADDARDTRTAEEPAPSERAERVAAAFREAGIDCTASGRMARLRWEKLAVNAGINPVTALLRADNAAVTEGSARAVARRAARETARVAQSVGVDLTPARAVERLDAVARGTAANRSSMAGDVAAGHRTEIDAITGTVIERAERAGVAVPTNRTLYELVRGWERAHVE